jgi:hypothetical protein
VDKKITTESLVEELKSKWGDKYDFSKVEYVDCKTKVCIICPEHGEFWALPNSIKKCGCHECAIEKRTYTTDTFIKKAIEKHGDKYDYSKAEYTKSHDKVCIVCPEHGEFWQQAYQHLQGGGCPKCGAEQAKKAISSNTEEFVKRAKQIHGEKFDYSKVQYEGNKKKVCIICPIHGEFWQTPDSHLRGTNCPKCGYDNIRDKKTLSTDEFIVRAKKVHGDKYDYSRTEYKGNDKKVCIICPEHGEFWQLAYDHLQGKGCQQCRMSRLENRIEKLLKENNIDYEYNVRPLFLKKGRSYRSLDFYLEKFGLAIECQGIQHFTDAPFYRRTKEEAYQRDLEKYNDCIKNNVKILYFADYIIDDYIDKVYNYEKDILQVILEHGKRLL